MAAVDILNLDGKKVGSLDLSDAIFAAPVKEHLLWEVVVAQRAARRAGTASTKGRGEVRGSTRKLFRQKGTGRARSGSIRASVYVGGGQVFGPKPRSYAKRVPKKVRRGALISALSLRLAESKLIVVEDFQLPEIKTKRVAGILAGLGAERSLIVDEAENIHLAKSVRNLADSKHIVPEGLNVYDVLRYPTLIVTVPMIKKLEERLAQ